MNKIKNTLFSNKPVTIDKNSVIMAIESSCDETACAIVKGGREVLANVVASQIKIHEAYGGVIPEIAAREHLEAINVVIDEAFKQANLKGEDITAFAGTVGPGLVGCLLVGLNAAKSFVSDSTSSAIAGTIIGVDDPSNSNETGLYEIFNDSGELALRKLVSEGTLASYKTKIDSLITDLSGNYSSELAELAAQ